MHPAQVLGRSLLNDDDTFQTDFTGAPGENCRSWALERQEMNKSIDGDAIVILDKRSAEDETVICDFYTQDVNDSLMPPGQKTNEWYTFRVPYQHAHHRTVDLPYKDSDDSYGVYLWRKA
jgi:hypothetical protein